MKSNWKRRISPKLEGIQLTRSCGSAYFTPCALANLSAELPASHNSGFPKCMRSPAVVLMYSAHAQVGHARSLLIFLYFQLESYTYVSSSDPVSASRGTGDFSTETVFGLHSPPTTRGTPTRRRRRRRRQTTARAPRSPQSRFPSPPPPCHPTPSRASGWARTSALDASGRPLAVSCTRTRSS